MGLNGWYVTVVCFVDLGLTLRFLQNRVAQGLSLIPNLTIAGITLSITPAIVLSPMTLKPQLSSPDTPTLAPTSRPNEPVDLASIARAVAESAPSLQFVAIDLSAARDASAAERAWFRVHEVGSGSARRVQKIGEQEGLSIAGKMRAFNRYD